VKAGAFFYFFLFNTRVSDYLLVLNKLWRTYPMGYKKISLGQMEQAVEGLQRELSVAGTTFTGARKKLGDSITSTTALSAKESGGVVRVSAASAYNINLPTPELGIEYTFVYSVAHGSNDVTITSTSDGSTGVNLFTGTLLDGNSSMVVQKDNLDVITFVGGTATIGDFVKVVCIGTGVTAGDPTWYVEARADADGAITIA
jgi:hypothetical protein